MFTEITLRTHKIYKKQENKMHILLRQTKNNELVVFNLSSLVYLRTLTTEYIIYTIKILRKLNWNNVENIYSSQTKILFIKDYTRMCYFQMMLSIHLT